MSIRLLNTNSPVTVCPKCKAYSFSLNLENLRKFFFSDAIICEKCGTELDWWNNLLRHFDWPIPHLLFGLVGAVGTTFVIDMKPEENTSINFDTLGIPKEANILSIGYTPNGIGVWPLEVHGNSPIRHFNPHKILLYGRPSGEPAETIPVVVAATWINASRLDNAWQNLLQAFEAYAISKYDSSIIPANVSVESTLNIILQSFLKRYASQERIEEFLDVHATYSHQLNILLPLAVKTLDFPSLPDHIRGNLNRLRDLRNEIAHKGTLTKSIEKKECALLLNSSIFGLGYLNLFEKHMKGES